MLRTKQDVEEQYFQFYQNEFRLQSFLFLKASMADTKRIKNPSDLYPLAFDNNAKRETKPFELTSEDVEFAKKMGLL